MGRFQEGRLEWENEECKVKLLTVWHKCPSKVSLSRRKGTRRKHNMKFRQIGHTTSQYGQLFFS